MGKITIRKKIGKSELGYVGDSKNFRESLKEAALYATTPDKCTLCESEDVTLDANTSQEGYIFIKVRCLNEKCGAAATLGVHKDEQSGWWKGCEIYEPKGNSSSDDSPVEKEEKKAKEKKKSDDEDEDFPF